MADKKKERKAPSLPFILRFHDKSIKVVEFNFMLKEGSKFKLDGVEFKVKGFDGPIIVVAKMKVYTEEELAEKEAKRVEKARQLFWGEEPIISEQVTLEELGDDRFASEDELTMIKHRQLSDAGC